MWPFKNTEIKPEPDEFGKLKAEFPEGMTFKYLGAKMIVVRYWEYYPIVDQVFCIICEYLDCHGQIKEKHFYLDDLPALRVELRRSDLGETG